jgi:hypothetical protein
MSSPDEDQPFSSPDPWHGQHQVPAQPAVLQQSPPPQQYWQPSPPVARQKNGLAIAALVVASLALLIGLGLSVALAADGLSFLAGGMPPAAGGLRGTAPQVVSGQEYPGRHLENEITRVYFDDGLDVARMACPATPAVVADAVTICHGSVDGADWSFRVTFQDGLGHFTLDEKVT